MRHLALLIALLAPFSASANESTYTERNLDACKTVNEDAESASVTLRCDGYKGLAVIFKEGDLRQSQTYGPIDDDYLEEAFESFGNFNHTNAKIEWRLANDGVPFATIVRWFSADPETTSEVKTRYAQILVVSTIATKETGTSCVVGYVDALENKDANTLARTVADDEAPGFTCGTDEPQWHGKRGKMAGEPMRHLPDNAGD